MTVTRRTVVLRAIAASAACVVPAGAGPGVERAAAATRTGDAGTGPVADHTLGEWKSLVGSELTVVGRPGLVLSVDRVEDFSHITRRNPMPGGGDIFTIRFTQRSGPALYEGIHTLHHPTFGHWALFLSPTGGEARHRAVVNTWLPLSGSGKALNGVGTVPR